MRKTTAAIGAAALGASLLLTACGPSNGGAGSAKSAAASVTANPTVQAELVQARLLVKSCFPAAPLDQLHTVHLVFLSSATGKNGPEVVVARDKLFNCLGVPRDRQDAFKNEAITAAEHQSPKVISVHPAAGVRQYLLVTLPQLVLKYKGTAAGMGTSTAQPSVPGTSISATPAATAGSPA